MNKVTVNRQNAESQDKGTGLGRLAPGRWREVQGWLPRSPFLPASVQTGLEELFLEDAFWLVVFWVDVFSVFQRPPPPCPLRNESVPAISFS